MSDKELQEFFETNKVKKMIVCKWYTDTDRSEESWVDSYEKTANFTHETALKYLTYEDVQLCIKAIFSEMKTLKMLEVYESQLENAMTDVRSATWVRDFTESSFFEAEKGVVDNILDGLVID